MPDYCNLPINQSVEPYRTQLWCNGTILDEQTLFIGTPAQMWAVFPLPEGTEDCELRFTDCNTETANALAQLAVFSNEPMDASTVYNEALRPLVHFTPKRGFHNDPNGLLYYNGLYHMFFQHNPYGLNHGNTHWGWAVSPDLLHWTERQPPLAPSDEDGMIFSGSGVVDYYNTSGLQTGEHPPILLFYTATGMRFFPKFNHGEDGQPIMPNDWVRPKSKQCIAVSLDGGQTFQKYGAVIDEIAPMNRDPKVRWIKDAGCWVMALYLTENDYMLLYSDDLLHWEHGETLTLPLTAECPDLFELYFDGDPAQPKWVFLGSPENYLVGHFEGRHFAAETDLIRDGESKTFTQASLYAPQTIFGLPRGEEIQIYWIPTVFPSMPFASCMSLPWKLSLISTADGPRLSVAPIEAAKQLRGRSITLNDETLPHFTGEALDLEAEVRFECPEGRLMLGLRGVPILLQKGGRELVIPTGICTLPEQASQLRIIADHGSIELFIGRYHTALNIPLDPGKKGFTILEQEGCSIEGNLWLLCSIWNKKEKE